MKQFQNKTVVILGGSKGIGLATAQLFAEEGAKIVITGRNEKNLTIAKDTIIADTLIITHDISNIDNFEKLYTEIQNKFGKIDSLFVNAANIDGFSLEQIDETTFNSVINTNYKGAFFAAKKALPFLNKKASIVFNASIAGIIAFDKHSLYSTTKAAIIHLTRSLAAELACKQIRVNAVSPGYIKTDAWEHVVNSSMFQKLQRKIPLGQRFGTAEEIAKVVVFLASDAASYITGQNIIVDGGFSTLFVDNIE